MKRVKYLPTILMLVLCVGVLAIGIYAVKPTKNSINGTLGINATNAEVSIECYVDDVKVATYNSVRAGINWDVGSLFYNTANANEIYEVADKEVMLKITNKSDKHLGAYFSNSIVSREATSADILTYDELSGTGDHAESVMSKVYLQSYSHIAPSTDTNGYNVVEMPMVFRCTMLDVVNIVSEKFSYYLNIEEYVPNVTADQIVRKTGDMTMGSPDLSGLVKLPLTDYGRVRGSSFDSNPNITHICVPSTIATDLSIERLGLNTNAFLNTSALIGVSIPKSITVISLQCFAGTGIKSIFLPEGITEIGLQAFLQASNLEMVSLPSTLKIIGGGSLRLLTKLEKIELNEGVTTIGGSAFVSSGIKVLEIPDSVEYIGSECFSKCTNLYKVKLSNNENLTRIEGNMFKGCTSLSNIEFPSNIKTICANSFYGSGLLSINVPGSVEVIETEAFCRSTNLTSVVIEEGVKEIGKNAFYGCIVKSITLPNSIEKLSAFAFYGIGIETNYEYKGAKYIGNNSNKYLALLSVDAGVTDLEVNNSCKFILYNAFKNVTTLKTISLPEGLKTMDATYLNQNLSLLNTETNPSLVKTQNGYYLPYGTNKYVLIGTYDTSGITSITLKSDCSLIGLNYAINLTSNVTEMVLPAGLTSLSDCVFETTKINKVNLNSVNEISASCFKGSEFTSLSFNDSLENIPYQACESATNLTSLTLPNGLKTIEYYAFYKCTSLTSITIPENVENIGHMAFYSCSGLKNVTINSLNVFKKITAITDMGYILMYASEITVPTSIVNECLYANSALLQYGFTRTDSGDVTKYTLG